MKTTSVEFLLGEPSPLVNASEFVDTRPSFRYTPASESAFFPTETAVAKRKQKRMSKEELRAPDQVELVLTKLWKSITRYKKWIIASLLIFIGGGVAYALHENAQKKELEGTAASLRAPLDPLVSPVVTNSTDADIADLKTRLGTNVYTDRKKQLEEALKGADDFLSQRSNSKAASAIKLVKASVQAPLGNPKEGAEALGTWLSENNGSSLELLVLFQLGDAQLASGQLAEAQKTYEKIKTSSPDVSLARAVALTRLGDLKNPMMSAKGDAAEALKQYEAAKEIVKADAANPLSRELDLKLAFLK
jgi:predicted negative regulator of RcsB-dependent stress response